MIINIEKNIAIQPSTKDSRNPKYPVLLDAVSRMENNDSFLLSCQMLEVDNIKKVKNILTNINLRLKNEPYRLIFRQIDEHSLRVWKVERQQ